MIKSQILYIVQTGKTDAFFESSEVEFVAWLFEFFYIFVLQCDWKYWSTKGGQFCLSSLKDYFGGFWLRV